MRLSTIIVSLALAVGLAIAVPAADPATTPTPTAEMVKGGKVPQFEEAPSDIPNPNGNGKKVESVVVGDKANTVSQRGDFNPLDERGYATLVLCPYRNCQGWCRGYNINYFNNRCYPYYYSAYIHSSGGFNHGVYAGYCYRYKCYGTLLRYVNTCYNIYPYINCWFKWW